MQRHHVFKDRVDVTRGAERGEPHQLVLAVVDLEPGERGEGGVEEAERVREVEFSQRGDVTVVAGGDYRRRPLADGVDRHDRRVGKRAGVVGGAGVGTVVVTAAERASAGEPEFSSDPYRNADFPPEPLPHHRAERRRVPRGDSQVSLEESVELDHRTLVEPDLVHVVDRESGLVKTERDGATGERGVMFDPREPLFLGRGDEPAVDDQGGRRVMIESRDSEGRGHWDVGVGMPGLGCRGWDADAAGSQPVA